VNFALSGWRAPAIVLSLAVALGVALRLAPCVRDPGFEYFVDGQYHERLTRQVVASGRLAEVDALSNAPVGRRTADHLPVGLYFAGAGLHRVLAAFGLEDVRWSLATLLALAGALIALPVWLGTTAVFGDRRAAAVAAMLAVFLPAHLTRTQGITLRYDGLGTLLVTAHVALALAALAEPRGPRRLRFSFAAALAFVAAMSVWRVSLVVLEVELACAVLRFVLRGPEPALRDLWLTVAIVGTLGLIPVGYLSEHRFLLSPIWLGVVGFGLALAILGPGWGRRWPLRLAALAAVGIIALGWGRFEAAEDYAGLASVLESKLGWPGGHDPNATLMLIVVELQSMSLRRFLTDWRFFSTLGALFAMSPVLFWWLGGRPSARQLLRMEAAPATLVVVAGALAVSTLLFQRSCVLLAPFLAITIGGLLVRSWTSAAVDHAPRRARQAPRFHRAPLGARRLVLAVIVIAVAGAMVSGVVTSGSSASRLAPNQKAAIEFLRTHAPDNAVVMCDWDSGYEIQSRTGRATVVDGLLESAENRRRIIELYAALMDPSSARLEALCRRYHASWLLLPPSTAIYAMAAVTGDPLAEVLARHEAVPRGPLTDHLIVHLLEGDPSYPGLRRALQVGGYVVFEVVGASQASR